MDNNREKLDFSGMKGVSEQGPDSGEMDDLLLWLGLAYQYLVSAE
jgi:hypothetical protein